jgi:hypothetical protein
MNARHCNTLLRTVVALALGALAAAIAGCGGSSQPSVQSIVNDTFHSHKQIQSGQLKLSFDLSASGLAGVSAPVALTASGPFESVAANRLPHFDLALSITTSGHTLHVGATSAAGNFYLGLEGDSFQMPHSTLQALQQGYAQSSKEAASSGPSTFATLGVNPGDWLEHTVRMGETDLGGARTIHLVAGLNLTRFLGDAARLSGASGKLGLGSSSSLGLSLAQAQALEHSISSARVDLYTGAEDHLLRSLEVHATIAASGQNSKELDGLSHATLDLSLQLSNLNQHQAITAPANPHPVSQLISLLRQLGLVSSTGTGASEQGSSEEKASSQESTGKSGSAPASPAYMTCIQHAGQSVSALQQCAKLVGG